MAEKIVKRDGSDVDFDQSKIVAAILKANGDVESMHRIPEQDAINIAEEITFKKKGKKASVEEIQDLVELALMQHGSIHWQRHICYIVISVLL